MGYFYRGPDLHLKEVAGEILLGRVLNENWLETNIADAKLTADCVASSCHRSCPNFGPMCEKSTPARISVSISG